MTVIVTGGCGFIGIHCVKRLLDEGTSVICIDNLSRPTAGYNLAELRSHPRASQSLRFFQIDIRDRKALEEVFRDAGGGTGSVEAVFHEAAQVAVTISVADPREDFEINALGTFNLLDATRTYCPEATFIFASTNKVYGALADVHLTEGSTRYQVPSDWHGVDERRPLDFHSPYGCSKGCADQYVRDFARVYGLRTFVFRQSCIYGTRQYGMEDQGWVAWFSIAAALGHEVSIYGDGKQVRDLLWVDDLLEAYWQAWKGNLAGGAVFNIGGGTSATLSVLELVEAINRRAQKRIVPGFARPRPGDQRMYISDISLAKRSLQWAPQTMLDTGLDLLSRWISDNQANIASAVQRHRLSEKRDVSVYA